jgi:hypothetical protein
MTYWDSSALIGALQIPAIAGRATRPNQATRIHSLSEVFSTLTGGRLGTRYLPSDAASMVQQLTADFHFIDLTRDEVQKALDEAQAKGIRGGRVHDWLHAVAATKANCDELLTYNVTDFQGLGSWIVTMP